MLIESTDNEIIIKIPAGSLDKNDLQYLLDFIRSKEIAIKSKATRKI